MKKKTIRVIDLHIQINSYLKANSAKTAGNTALAEAQLTLATRIELERQMECDLEMASGNIATERHDARIDMANLSDAMRRRVQSAYPGNSEQFKQANVTYSDVAYGAYLTGISRAKNVYDMADALSTADKTKFMVTDETLEVLNAAIEKCEALNPSTRSKTVLRRNTDKNLHDTLKQTTKFIHEKIDSLMGGYRVSDNSLYSGYLMSREFQNPRSSHAQIMGRVTDSNGPLRGVKVIATNGIKTFEDMTNKTGDYKIPVSPELYTINFVLPKYNSQQVDDVFVDAAEHEIVNTRLTPATN